MEPKLPAVAKGRKTVTGAVTAILSRQQRSFHCVYDELRRSVSNCVG